MELFKLIALSIIQGVTELLPVSSSGHLLLFSDALEIENTLLLFTWLHLASALAITFAYHTEILRILRRRDRYSITIKIIIGIIPAVIAALLIEDLLEEIFYTPLWVAFELALWGIVMIYAEKLYIQKQSSQSIEAVSVKQSLQMGLAQIIALIPGTSRSGITTIAGIFAGVEKSTALDFSFLMGIPLLIGSFLYEGVKNRAELISFLNQGTYIALIVTFATSYLAISILRALKGKNFLTFFGIYRILVASLIVVSIYLF